MSSRSFPDDQSFVCPLSPRRSALRSRPSVSRLQVQHLIWPLFVQEGTGPATPIASMPGCARWTLDHLAIRAQEAAQAGLAGIALFPVVADPLKDARGREGLNPDGLMSRAIRVAKASAPELLVMSDVALDPYSSDGHDGVVIDGRIDNDETLPLLAQMAVVQAQAGADLFAPSDMMDGRIGV
ncbi:MAG: porphobilinogen synthase, partial [Nitrospirales bacterium]|nr:porphobilinogen synthase [Nitrospirales bacterium]